MRSFRRGSYKYSLIAADEGDHCEYHHGKNRDYESRSISHCLSSQVIEGQIKATGGAQKRRRRTMRRTRQGMIDLCGELLPERITVADRCQADDTEATVEW